MAVRKTALQVCLLIVIGSSLVLAGDFKRFEIQPFGGFTASGGIPVGSDGDALSGKIDVKSSHNVGFTLGVNINEADAVEGHWRRQFTEGRLPAGISTPVPLQDSPLFRLTIDQVHANFLHHYVINQPKALPYVVGAVGVTTYYASHNGQNLSRSHFSFALGGGLKYLFNPYFGLRAEARWAPTLLSASDSGFWCRIGGVGAQCRIKLETTLHHQLDLIGGVIFRF
jgi:Outer membrane protein beta-barrel domain